MQFELLSNVIKGKDYDKSQILNMMDVYLTCNKISLEQYSELISLVDSI